MISEKNSIFYSHTFMDYAANFLEKGGGIAISSVDKLLDVMKESHDKLVPKCMAITIISLSSPDVQMKLCESGVWNILFQWLQDGLKNDTTCFIVEILRLYLTLPISFENLISNSCPKLIKKLTKNGNPDIISIAKNIVTKWKRIVEERHLKDVSEVPAKKIKLDNNVAKIDKNIDEKKKIRTAKVRNTDLRTAGIEDPETDQSKMLKKPLKKPEDKPGMEEMHQKVSVTADKKKVLEIHESKNFINSIMQTPAPPKKKKKRLDVSINKSTSDVSITDDGVIDGNAKESPLPDVFVVTDKPKKRVSWAPSDSLQNIKYFELDENERVNVNKVSIEEMKKKERMIERQHASHKFSSDEPDDDSQAEKWYKPNLVNGVPGNKIEVNSVEKAVQFERERKVLKVLYFVKEAVPSSPTEPDNEPYDVKEPLIIPLDDIITPKTVIKATSSNEGNSKVLVYTEKEGSECHVTLRPDVANLLKSMTQNSNTNNTSSSESSNLPEATNGEPPQTRTKLINILRSRYPDIDPEKLSSEEVCKLLEPMRDQLIHEGIISLPQAQLPTQQILSIPPPNFPTTQAPPWFPDPRSHFQPRQLLQQHQRMPLIPFPPPPSQISRPPFNPPLSLPQQPQRHMRPVCRFLANTGFCRSGNNCAFSHLLPDGPRFNQNRH